MTADEIATFAKEKEAKDIEQEEDEGDPEWDDDIEEIKNASDSNIKGTINKVDTASNNLNN